MTDQLELPIDVDRCNHQRLKERNDGRIQCAECKRTWPAGEWERIVKHGLELDR